MFRILVSLKFVTAHAGKWTANFTVFKMPVSSPNCLRDVCAVSFLLFLPAPLLLIGGSSCTFYVRMRMFLQNSSADFACHCGPCVLSPFSLSGSAAPWTAARSVSSLSSTVAQRLLKLMSIQ